TRRCGCSGKRHPVTGSPLSKTLPAHFGARHIAYNCHHPNGRERALKRRAVMPLHVKLIFGSLACPHQEINNQMADYPADTLDRQDYPDAMSERTSVLETLAAETRVFLTSLREDMHEMRADMREMRREMQGGFDALRQETQSSSAALRQEINTGFADVRRAHDRDFRLTWGA